MAVTGAASGVGALLTRRLVASEEIKQVIAIDERRGEVAEAQWHILDVRDPAIADKLRGADVVVHLALDLDLSPTPPPAPPTTSAAPRPSSRPPRPRACAGPCCARPP